MQKNLEIADTGPVTTLLNRASEGNEAAVQQIMPLIYDQLREIAGRLMRQERQGHLLQTTALVHEAYLKMIDQTRVRYHDRLHFQAMAATAMRRILIDYARSSARAKRGGGVRHETLSGNEAIMVKSGTDQIDLLALEEAMQRLQARDPRCAKVVEYRFYGGMTIQETAKLLNISPATVKREWDTARAILHFYLTGRDTHGQ